MWCGVSMCVRVHAKSLVKFEKLFLDNKLFPRTFPPATAKIKQAKIKNNKDGCQIQWRRMSNNDIL